MGLIKTAIYGGVGAYAIDRLSKVAEHEQDSRRHQQTPVTTSYPQMGLYPQYHNPSLAPSRDISNGQSVPLEQQGYHQQQYRVTEKRHNQPVITNRDGQNQGYADAQNDGALFTGDNTHRSGNGEVRFSGENKGQQ